MMKIVTLELTAEQKKQLKDLQNNGSGYLLIAYIFFAFLLNKKIGLFPQGV